MPDRAPGIHAFNSTVQRRGWPAWPGHDGRVSSERLRERLDRALERAGRFVREVARGADRLQDLGLAAADMGEQAVLIGAHPVDGERIEIAVDAGVDDDDLLLHFQRRELRLLEKFGQARAAVEEALRGRVEVRA